MSDPNPQRDADLIRRLAPGLVLLARQWCRSAEDVVQDAFLKLFRQQVQPDNATAWLYRVVRHDAMNAGRADSRRSRHERLASENRDVWFDPAPGQSLDIKTITDSLRNQPLELRETIVARLWGGLSFDEIALLTGTSASTASRRYRVGLESLRQQLGVIPEEREK
jgi:RNA polymerase sigma-70 factor (ECF subfamily)